MEPPPTNIAELLERVRAGWRPKFVFFWSHEPTPAGALGGECFSQWYGAPFEIDGVVYATAEHYMMWSKAQLFGDEEAAHAILAAANPGAAKRLGRDVRGFDSETWDQRRSAIVVRANLAKFGQQLELQRCLLGTRDRVLAEASPSDRIWGIGREADDERAKVPAQWTGLNLLGFALMAVRASLVG